MPVAQSPQHQCRTVLPRAAADSLARWLRLDKNNSVFFATGTDEHGQKIEKAAKDAGKNVKLFCDEV
ncbi:MAG: hypothetical protein EBS99_00805, partial [Betaproteobacteria bacterium]|nr:hypothetical protein [Betaproteobacteria bacterium]